MGNCKFVKRLSKGVSKPTFKFLTDMLYELAKNGSCLISKIAKALDEKIRLINVIERLCDNLANLNSEEKSIIWNNYIKLVAKHIDKSNPIALFDDSDINKEYSRKLEDLDKVIDASSQDKRIVNDYHVCEAVVLTQNQAQQISVYSKIYSCKSESFKSMNTYTQESIKAVENVLGTQFIGVFNCGYDDNKIIDYMSNDNRKIVIRLNDKRVLLFKEKRRKVEEVANSRKGKIVYKALFDNDAGDLTISYTKAVLPYNKKEYTLVIIYGLSDKHLMKLLTNIKVKRKEDVIKIVRLYLSRWRIEEYFKGKKQEYDFENMRVRTLESMNNLNMILTILLGYIAILADNINNRLLTIKIIYASQSLKNTCIVWFNQMARGIKAILEYANRGIKEWEYNHINIKYEQLTLDI